MKEDIDKRVEKELASLDKIWKESLHDKWIGEIFMDEEARSILLTLIEIYRKEKSEMIPNKTLLDIMGKKGIGRHRTVYLLDRFVADGILVREKVHGKEAHFHIRKNDGKNMLVEAMEAYFDYIDSKDKDEEEKTKGK
jgi:DNA-binding transcriptional regulator PaaX